MRKICFAQKNCCAKNDLRKKQVSGFYKDVEIMPSEYEQDNVKKKYDEIDGLKPSYGDKVVK